MKLFNISFRKTPIGWSVFIPTRRSQHSLVSKEIKSFEISKEKTTPIKLNVGGGKGHPTVPGWTVVDIRSHADVVLDISREPLPYKDNSVDVIFCSHTLEHIIPQRFGFCAGRIFSCSQEWQ